jgi:hypothetical protein
MHHARQDQDGADRQVDAARRDDDGHPDPEDQDDRHVQADRAHVRLAEEARFYDHHDACQQNDHDGRSDQRHPGRAQQLDPVTEERTAARRERTFLTTFLEC